MTNVVTVAIPTLNAGAAFADTLTAVRGQVIDREVQLVVCDSESSDDTVALARSHGAEVISIPRASFSHGGTRNLLMARSRGDHVAFLTQDAVPAAPDWLDQLVGAFTLAARVGLAFGPYLPRPGARLSVTRELTTWFGSFTPEGGTEPRIDVLDPAEAAAPAVRFLGHLGYFTDANGCVARAAWEQVAFRAVSYAEDHLLAQDMLRAGFAKVYVPEAAVVHSHEYTPLQWLRRSYDEARAVREVYDCAAPLTLRSAALQLWGEVGADLRWARSHAAEALPPRHTLGVLARSTLHHAPKVAGATLGGHGRTVPSWLSRRLSLEGRTR